MTITRIPDQAELDESVLTAATVDELELSEIAHQVDDVAQDLEYIMRRYGQLFAERDRCLVRSGLERMGEVAVALGI